MKSYEYISSWLEGNAVLGKREEISPRLSIIPIYKLKVSCINLTTDIKYFNIDHIEKPWKHDPEVDK